MIRTPIMAIKAPSNCFLVSLSRSHHKPSANPKMMLVWLSKEAVPGYQETDDQEEKQVSAHSRDIDAPAENAKDTDFECRECQNIHR